jgi:hypothetical protein
MKTRHFQNIRKEIISKQLQQFEKNNLSEYSSRSCHKETFIKYLQLRKNCEEQSKKDYKKLILRNLKFNSYCLKRSSEDRFFKKIKTYFNTEASIKIPKWMSLVCKDGRSCSHDKWSFEDNIEDDKDTISAIIGNIDRNNIIQQPEIQKQKTKTKLETKDISENNFKKIRIIIGNWGKNPNLKNSAPTPGIGFKRKLAKKFEIVETSEHYTSKTCPCCLKLSTKCPKKTTQLLRCENVNCRSKLWSRDVLGAFNILYKTLREIMVGCTKALPSCI